MATAAVASFVPLLALMWFWQGFGPDNEARVDYLQHGLRFKPAALTLYLALLSAYLAPVIALNGLPITRRTVLVGAGALCAYPLWPVVAADVQLAAGITTAGLLHRAVSSVGLPLAAHAFWAVAAAVGASIAAGFGARTWRAVHHDRDLADGLLCVTVLWFLLLMPFSDMYLGEVLHASASVRGARDCAGATSRAASSRARRPRNTSPMRRPADSLDETTRPATAMTTPSTARFIMQLPRSLDPAPQPRPFLQVVTAWVNQVGSHGASPDLSRGQVGASQGAGSGSAGSITPSPC